MSTFNEADHPRARDGKFTDKPQTAPDVALLSPRDAHFEAVSAEAGFGGIGPHLLSLGISQIEDDLDEDELADITRAITAETVTAGYEHYVAPGIDRIESEIRRLAPAPTDNWREKAAAAAEQAGLEVMGEVLDIIADREVFSDNSVLGSLTAEELSGLYFQHLSDRVQQFAEHELLGLR